MRVLLATHNAKKLAELRRILDASGVGVVGLDEVPGHPEPRETGITFEENALLKARIGALHSGLPTVADDSGLAVDVLNGMPGVFSARWAGKHGDDVANLELVLAQLSDVPERHLGAAFVCVAALVLPDGREVLGEGVIRGVIAEQATNGRERGFPFRSVFYLPSLGKYYLDLTGEEHERINHRRAALVPVRAALERYAAVPGT